LKAIIRSIAALAMFAFSAPAIAGGVNVYDDGEAKLKLGAKVYVDATRTIDQTNGVKTNEKKGFNLTRTYLTAKYTFNSDWMMRVTTDVVQENGLAKKKTNVFLKYAYLQGKLLDDALVLRLGVSHNPWIDYEQGLWKHRYFSKVTTDTFKYDDSADIGLGLKGTVADGLVKYWATAVNGGGYGDLTQTNGIDYKSRLSIYPVKGLTLDFGYNTGNRATKKFGAANVQKQTMYQVMASYGTHDYRLGGNYIRNKDRTVSLIRTKPVDATTYAVWGWAKIVKGFGVVGRYENEKTFKFNANGVVLPNSVEQTIKRYVVGLDYTPVKHVNFTLGYIQKKTANAGHVVGNTAKATQIGLWTQLKY